MHSGQKVLVDSLFSLDDGSAEAMLSDQFWGSTVEIVCIDLLLPAWRAIEERRALGLATDAQVSFGQGWIVRKLLSILDLSNPDHGRQDVVVAAMHDRSGWLQSLGYAIVLSRAGYSVALLGHTVSVADAWQAAALRSPNAVLLVGVSALSRQAVRAAASHAGRNRAEPWYGLLAGGMQIPDDADDMIVIPLHATRTAIDFERASNAWPTCSTGQGTHDVGSR